MPEKLGKMEPVGVGNVTADFSNIDVHSRFYPIVPDTAQRAGGPNESVPVLFAFFVGCLLLGLAFPLICLNPRPREGGPNLGREEEQIEHDINELNVYEEIEGSIDIMLFKTRG